MMWPTNILGRAGFFAGCEWTLRGVPELDEAAERMTAAVELSRKYPAAPIVFSGGEASLILTGAKVADWKDLFWEAAHQQQGD
jgi:hypothetical protein